MNIEAINIEEIGNIEDLSDMNFKTLYPQYK